MLVQSLTISRPNHDYVFLYNVHIKNDYSESSTVLHVWRHALTKAMSRHQKCIQYLD